METPKSRNTKRDTWYSSQWVQVFLEVENGALTDYLILSINTCRGRRTASRRRSQTFSIKKSPKNSSTCPGIAVVQ